MDNKDQEQKIKNFLLKNPKKSLHAAAAALGLLSWYRRYKIKQKYSGQNIKKIDRQSRAEMAVNFGELLS